MEGSNTNASPSAAMKAMKEKLRELEMKKNAARGMLKKATEDEVTMEKVGPKALEKKEKEEEEKRLAQFKAKLQEEGIDPEKYHLLHQTQVRLLLDLALGHEGPSHSLLIKIL